MPEPQLKLDSKAKLRQPPAEGWTLRFSFRLQLRLGRVAVVVLEDHNEKPRPFVWTKSADDIIASIHRFCLRTIATDRGECARTSETGH